MSWWYWIVILVLIVLLVIFWLQLQKWKKWKDDMNDWWQDLKVWIKANCDSGQQHGTPPTPPTWPNGGWG